ncbi:MAG: hypothetical protein Q7S03_00275 [bacterium]|nr:hypothetical protein [bacterium]
MAKQSGFIVTPVIFLVSIVILAVVGSISLSQKTSERSRSPQSPNQTPPAATGNSNPGTFNGDLRTLPTTPPAPSPIIFNGEQSEIKMTTSKSNYNHGENVEVSVVNNSKKPFSFLKGPSCDISFQRKVNGNWQETNFCSNCGSAAPCVTTVMQPGESYSQKIPINNQTVPGTYRGTFRFMTGSVYSNEFQIR